MAGLAGLLLMAGIADEEFLGVLAIMMHMAGHAGRMPMDSLANHSFTVCITVVDL